MVERMSPSTGSAREKVAEKLLPCPFCGTKPSLREENGRWSIKCDYCCTIMFSGFNQAEKATGIWNCRIEPEPLRDGINPGPSEADIVERLQAHARSADYSSSSFICFEAADEIERYRGILGGAQASTDTYRETVRRVAAAREKGYAAARANLQEAWSALTMVREAVETLSPSGSVKAAEHLDGPTFMHEAEALVAGIMAIAKAARPSTAKNADAQAVVMPENPPETVLAWLSDLRGHHTQSEHANSGRRRYALMRAEIAALASPVMATDRGGLSEEEKAARAAALADARERARR